MKLFSKLYGFKIKIRKNTGRSIFHLIGNALKGKAKDFVHMNSTTFLLHVRKLPRFVRKDCKSMPLVRRGLTPSLLLILRRIK